MARVAERRRRDVLRRLRRRAHARALCVAAAAARRRADELPVDVAALAFRELVRSVEAERGREMIEHGPWAALRVRPTYREQNEQHADDVSG
jgi:hypothetical protein